MENRSTPPLRAVPFLIGVAGLGLLARFLLSGVSVGTNDAHSWLKFATLARQFGVYRVYELEPLFNHPPLMGHMVSALLSLSEYLATPFPFMLRLPGVIGECLVALLLWKIWSRRASSDEASQVVLLFSWGMASILVSGYHGNTDPIYAFLVLLAAYILEEKQNFLFAGLILGAALNVKLIPLIFIFPVFAFSRSLNDIGRLLTGLLPFAIPFVFAYANLGEVFWANVFEYNSQRSYWGFPMFLLLSQGSYPQYADQLVALADLYGEVARFLIFGSIAVLSIINYKYKTFDLYEMFALTAALFAIFAPGFGGQYFVLYPALLFAVSKKWGFQMSTIMGICLASSYYAFLINWMPLESSHTHSAPHKGLVFLSFIVWLAVCVFFIETVAKKFKKDQST